MYSEITCPYCEHSYDLCHDDGAFYNEDVREQETCPECDKVFMVSSSVSWNHEAEKADCLNGGEHQWSKITGAPREYFVGKYRCDGCDEETKFTPEEEKAKGLIK